MNKILIAGAILIGFLLAILIFAPGKRSVDPTSHYPQLSIGNKATITVEIAQTPQEHERGLSYRANLAPDHGMLFIFPQPGIYSFWMKEMRFPLDFMWIDGKNNIVYMHENVPAPDPSTPLTQLPAYYPKMPITKVLEVTAGFIKKNKIVAGDIVRLKNL